MHLILIIYIFFCIDRVATDHNEDNTTAILHDWLVKVQKLYHYVEWRPKEEPRFVILKMELYNAQIAHRKLSQTAHEMSLINTEIFCVEIMKMRKVQKTGQILVMSMLWSFGKQRWSLLVRCGQTILW